MFRAAFGAGIPRHSRTALIKENAMADPTKRSDGNGQEPTSSGDADLTARLKSLDARLDKAAAQRSRVTESPARSKSDSSAVSQAFRLSAEFVSGVIAGGIVGWLVDRLFGISPWGLIVCVILGFCAGMLNLLRAAGLLRGAKYDEKR
jgi:ATP synthase protein I